MALRIIEAALALPFVLCAIAAWRFYAANPDAHERTPRDYVRETLRDRRAGDRR